VNHHGHHVPITGTTPVHGVGAVGAGAGVSSSSMGWRCREKMGEAWQPLDIPSTPRNRGL